MTDTDSDPKGLIRESYLIEGITPGECRSIFMDWALSLPPDADMPKAIHTMLARHREEPDHPMTTVLTDGLVAAPEARRRGGRAGRFAQNGH